MSATIEKNRSRPAKTGKVKSLDNYMDKTLDFQEFCDEHDLNFRQSMIAAMRLYRLKYRQRKSRHDKN